VCVREREKVRGRERERERERQRERVCVWKKERESSWKREKKWMRKVEKKVTIVISIVSTNFQMKRNQLNGNQVEIVQSRTKKERLKGSNYKLFERKGKWNERTKGKGTGRKNRKERNLETVKTLFRKVRNENKRKMKEINKEKRNKQGSNRNSSNNRKK